MLDNIINTLMLFVRPKHSLSAKQIVKTSKISFVNIPMKTQQKRNPTHKLCCKYRRGEGDRWICDIFAESIRKGEYPKSRTNLDTTEL